MVGLDARSKVGEYVWLAWQIHNKDLSPPKILDALEKIGVDHPIGYAVKGLFKTDCYNGWTESLRYFLYRYEESLARSMGQSLNGSQWNKIWRDEPSKSVEHVKPQSKGSDNPNTGGIYVHRLGNLVMLPPGVNSKLKDSDPRMKAKTYETCGLLDAVQVGRVINHGKWSRLAVERRERKLIKWAINEWGD